MHKFTAAVGEKGGLGSPRTFFCAHLDKILDAVRELVTYEQMTLQHVKVTHLRNIRDVMETPRCRLCTDILGEIGKIKIQRPNLGRPKIGQMSGIGPEHETSNGSLKLTAWLRGLLLQFCMRIQPSIRGVDFIIDPFLIASNRRLPEAFERREMKLLRCFFRECSFDDIYQTSSMKAFDCEWYSRGILDTCRDLDIYIDLRPAIL